MIPWGATLDPVSVHDWMGEETARQYAGQAMTLPFVEAVAVVQVGLDTWYVVVCDSRLTKSSTGGWRMFHGRGPLEHYLRLLRQLTIIP